MNFSALRLLLFLTIYLVPFAYCKAISGHVGATYLSKSIDTLGNSTTRVLDTGIAPSLLQLDAICNESVQVSLEISNQGTEPLNWQYTGSTTHYGVPRVLLSTNGSPLGQNFQTRIDAINSQLSSYELIVFEGTFGQMIPYLDSVDVVVLSTIPSNVSQNNSFRDALSAFVFNGGTVILNRVGSTAFNWLRLLDSSVFNPQTAAYTVLDPLNPMCTGVVSDPQGLSLFTAYVVTTDDYVSLIDYNHPTIGLQSLAGYREYGSGRIYLHGGDLNPQNVNFSRLIANMIRVGPNYSYANLFDLDIEQGELEVGETQVINLTFNAASILNGNYSSQLSFLINGAINERMELDVNMLVSSSAELSISEQCLDFGQMNLFSGETRGTWLRNTGCDVIDIENIESSISNFSLNTIPTILEPGDSLWLSATGFTDQLGLFEFQIEVQTDEGEFVFCASGEGIESNELEFSADTIHFNYTCSQDAESFQLLISNFSDTDVDLQVVNDFEQDDSYDILVLSNVNGGFLTSNPYQVMQEFELENTTVNLLISTNLEEIENALAATDLVFFVASETSNSAELIPLIGDLLDEFVTNGGRIIIGELPDAASYGDLGFFETDFVNVFGVTTGATLNLSSPYSIGLQPFLTFNPGIFSIDANLPNETSVLSVDGFDVIFSKPHGSGEVIFFGSNFYWTASSIESLLKNMIIHRQEPVADNIVLSSSTLSLASQSQATLDIQLMTEGLKNGAYEVPLVITNGAGEFIDSLIVAIEVYGPPCASFSFTSDCSNRFRFQNTSNNEYNSVVWNFGLPSPLPATSELDSPSFWYSASGIYNVTLVVCNEVGCDTLVQSITAGDENIIIPPLCSPSPNAFYLFPNGISNFSFETINNTTEFDSIAYKDYSCSISTTAHPGDFITYGISTIAFAATTLFIDFNNNGNFDNATERFNPTAINSSSFSQTIQIPLDVELNTPVRMRVVANGNNSPVLNACSSINRGEVEDYSITFIPSNEPPVANFTVSQDTLVIGETVNLINLTTGGATSYQWLMESAVNSISTESNPSNHYSFSGTYDITLIASNQFGSDTLTIEDIIYVDEAYSVCASVDTIYAPSGTIVSAPNIENGFIQSAECGLVISPPCAKSVTLLIENYDFITQGLFIYDGVSNEGELLWYSGDNFEQETVVANSGSLYIFWDTHNTVWYGQSFQLSWSSNSISNGEVVANFELEEDVVAFGENVQFTSMSSSNALNWYWTFGDGSYSHLENPIHSYSAPGIYEVILSVGSCDQNDQISRFIEVQEPPSIELEGISPEINVGCGNDNATFINLTNTGSGELLWNVNDPYNGQFLEILVLGYGTDLLETTANMINGISDYYNDYSIAYSVFSSSTQIASIIFDYDVVLLPPLLSGFQYESGVDAIFNQYVENGGTIIKCLGNSPMTEINTSGLFEANGFNESSIGVLTVTQNTALTLDIPESISNPASTTSILSNSNDQVPLIEYLNNDVFLYRNIGTGRAYCLGLDFSEVNDINALVLSRAVYVNNGDISNLFPVWLSASSNNGSLQVGETGTFALIADDETLDNGIYNSVINLFTNDPDFPVVELDLSVYVGTAPCASIEYTTSCNGDLIVFNTSTNFDTSEITIDGFGTFSDENIQVLLPMEGEYSITVQACNEITCVSNTQQIYFSPSSPLVAEICTPNTTPDCCNNSLTLFSSSSGSNEFTFDSENELSYNDWTCGEFIFLLEDINSSFTVNAASEVFASAFIDYNSNNIFDSDEVVFSLQGQPIEHNFIVPSGSTLELPLRMRLILDDNEIISDPCSAPIGGAVYDFSVIIIAGSELPSSSFIVNNSCSPLKNFQNASSNATSFHWDFGDGATSQQENPTHVYSSLGEYEVVLIASNQNSFSTYSQTVFVGMPDDEVSFSGDLIPNSPIQFSLANSYDSYLWQTSDGQVSTDESPSFTFLNSGLQSVSVTVSLENCTGNFSIPINLNIDGVFNTSEGLLASLYPNPTNNFAYLELSNYVGETLVVDLLDVTGRLIGPCRKISEGEGTLKYLIEPSVNGVYLIRMSAGVSSKTFRLVVSK